MIINRNGYGSNFNILKIVGDKIVKCSFNIYGKEKLMNESKFYEYVVNKNNGFCDYIPIIYEFISVNDEDLQQCSQQALLAPNTVTQENTTRIEMEYLKDYTPLYLSYSNFCPEKRKTCLKTIMNHLQHIHNIRIPIERHVFEHDLFMETIQKIETRIKNVLPLIQKVPYKNITHIQNNITGNTVNIRTLDEIKSVIKQNVDFYLNDEATKYEYGIIHGDCQFNNILINKNDELKFIDPRGYYGSTQLYGLIEYDIAKICFALSGYDTFDNSSSVDVTDLRSVKSTDDRGLYVTKGDVKPTHIGVFTGESFAFGGKSPNVEGRSQETFEKIIISSSTHTIQVDIELCDDTYIQTQSTIVKTLLCAIWLSNSHIFTEDEPKCITSYFIAMYMCSHYLFD